MDPTELKLQKLTAYIKELKRVAVAFSGGVDSSFLLKTACDTLGGDHVAAYTFVTDFFTRKEIDGSARFCEKYGIKQQLIYIDILSDDEITKNAFDRCYLCKKKMFSLLKEKAAEEGIPNVTEGSNADDANDYRPGMKAVAELGILSPLMYAGLTKNEIRSLAKKAGLNVWDKPSLACLASRFAYGEELTKDRLLSVEKAEEMLRDLGLKQVRVRVHGDIARIEAEKESINKLTDAKTSKEICAHFKELGFRYVTVDLDGYRTGSMSPAQETTVKP